jgi:Ser/Thr protein kinase RdoA (MazF antagonist)
MVPGADAPDGPDGPDAVLARLLGDPAAAARVGTALGQILAELHTRVTAADVAGWLPRRPAWPEPRAWVRDRLPRVVDDRVLHARADAVMARYEAALALAAEDDRALVHTDLGLHNVGVDLATWRVCGVFDWGDACWADRHLDFRHLVLDPARGELLDGVAAAYEAAAGRAVSRARVALYNAACAVGHLAFRAGVPPERRWCGRTLAEDLGWTRHALARAEAAGR